MKLLHIDSSILGDNSVSRQITAEIVSHYRAAHNVLDVTTYDLAAKPIAHLAAADLAGLASSNEIEEFLAADILVIGAPLYNFGIPSQLKAWIDRIAVAGKTFRYSEKGPEGLAVGKKAIVALSRGGVYHGTPLEALEHQESYLRAVLNFLGVTDIQFVRAEGIAFGPEQREKAIAEALDLVRSSKAA